MILTLVEEMDAYYGDVAREDEQSRAAQIHDHLFGPTPSAQAVVARDGDSVIGSATFSSLWPAQGTTRSLYLKELYVLEAWRGQGVGHLIMDEVERLARALGCSRLEFTTDVDNVGAQAFYGRLGYAPHPGKLFYRRNLA